MMHTFDMPNKSIMQVFKRFLSNTSKSVNDGGAKVIYQSKVPGLPRILGLGASAQMAFTILGIGGLSYTSPEVLVNSEMNQFMGLGVIAYSSMTLFAMRKVTNSIILKAELIENGEFIKLYPMGLISPNLNDSNMIIPNVEVTQLYSSPPFLILKDGTAGNMSYFFYDKNPDVEIYDDEFFGNKLYETNEVINKFNEEQEERKRRRGPK
jgi:hypothetical protein